jgi:ABC-type transport system substrate-binding protein
MFADKRVRRAMTYAFDRQRVIDNVWAGLGVVTTSPYLPGSPNIDPDIKPIPFDLAESKKLLAQAGWTDTNGDGLLDKELHVGDGKRSPFEFHFAFTSGQKESETTAKILADDLLKVGVKMIIDPMEWSLFTKRREDHEFDAIMTAWLLPWYTDLYQVWHSSQIDVPKGSNVEGFRNAKADQIIEKLRLEFDPAERVRLFREFHRIVDDEQPYTFFMVRKKVWCGWNDVQNFIFAKDFPIENSLPWWVGSVAH